MGDVTVSNQNGLTDLTVDDSKDAAAQVATLTAAALTGLTPGSINFTQLDLNTFTINGGTGGNRFTVTNTPKTVRLTTQLNTGTGDRHCNRSGDNRALEHSGARRRRYRHRQQPRKQRDQRDRGCQKHGQLHRPHHR